MTAAPSELGLCGTTVYHRVDADATRLFQRAVRVLARAHYIERDTDGRWRFTEAATAWNGGSQADGGGPYWLWSRVYRRYTSQHPGADRWWWMPYPNEVRPGDMLSLCGYLRYGPAHPVGWIRENFPTMRPCKSKSCWPTPTPAKSNAGDAAQALRVYRHLVDCETCLHEGVLACEIFPRLVSGELESDLDPRLDPDA